MSVLYSIFQEYVSRPWYIFVSNDFQLNDMTFMLAYHWGCQQALCRETYFTIGLPFTKRPFFWLVKPFIMNDRNCLLNIFEGFMTWKYFDAYIIFYLSESIDHSTKVISASDFQSIFPDSKLWLIQVRTV